MPRSPLHILTIVGARPQFVKAAVVSKAIGKCPDVSEVLVHTGQHYDRNMSGIFFDELGMSAPSYNLGIGSGTHGTQTGAMLEAIERVIMKEEPDVVLLYGDTNSTLAGALAAAKVSIPIAHVEAGLRSYNRRMPEEINRVMADHLADLLLVPTARAVENLAAEGIRGDRVVLVGDVMYDIALQVVAEPGDAQRILAAHGCRTGEYILATIHRAENTESEVRMQAIVDALLDLAQEHKVVLPAHPRTRDRLKATLAKKGGGSSLDVIDPIGYREMAVMEAGAQLILTDSGGVQKEAYFHRVPCVTVRAETEWVELVSIGWNTLAPPTSAAVIVSAAKAAMKKQPRETPPLYGNGHAAEYVVTELQRRFGSMPAA